MANAALHATLGAPYSRPGTSAVKPSAPLFAASLPALVLQPAAAGAAEPANGDPPASEQRGGGDPVAGDKALRSRLEAQQDRLQSLEAELEKLRSEAPFKPGKEESEEPSDPI